MPPSYCVEITVESPSLYVALIRALNTDTPTPPDVNSSLTWKRTSDRGLEDLRIRVNNELMALAERNVRCAQECWTRA